VESLENKEFRQNNLLININSCVLEAMEDCQQLRGDITTSVKFGLIKYVYALRSELIDIFRALLREIILACPESSRLNISTLQSGDDILCTISAMTSPHIAD